MVDFQQIRSWHNKENVTEHLNNGYYYEKDDFHYLEFYETDYEFDYRLKRIIRFNDELVAEIRCSDDGQIYTETIFMVEGKSIGFYEYKDKPTLNSNLSGNLLSYEYSLEKQEIKYDFELFVEGIKTGVYKTTITYHMIKGDN